MRLDTSGSDFKTLTNSCSMLSTKEMTAVSAIGLSQNRQLQSFPNEKIYVYYIPQWKYFTEIILPILFEVGSMSPWLHELHLKADILEPNSVTSQHLGHEQSKNHFLASCLLLQKQKLNYFPLIDTNTLHMNRLWTYQGFT